MAKVKLKELEQQNNHSPQTELFSKPAEEKKHPVLAMIDSSDINEMTPLAAHQFLNELKLLLNTE